MLESFRARLLAWGWGVLLVLLGLLVFSLSWTERELLSETEQRAVRHLEAVRWLLADHAPIDDPARLEAWVETLGARSGIRISLIDHGRVLADSEVSFEGLGGLEDHSRRPEVLQALAGGQGMDVRYSATLRKDMLYAARRVEAAGALPAGVLRVAIPVSQVRSRLAEVRGGLLWGFASALALVLLLSWLLTRSLTRSVRSVAERAKAIGAGRYQDRLWAPPRGEFRPLAEAVNAMAASIELHVSTIETQKEQLKAMFEGLSEGVMVLDCQGRLLTFNRAMHEIIPLPLTAPGKTVLELTRRVELQDAVLRVLAASEDRREELDLELPGDRQLRVSVVPFVEPAGRRVVLVFHDVSALRRGERALRDFVTNVSHQLRTPLTSIRGYAETLRDAPPPDDKGRTAFLSTIIRNSRHMEGVLTAMLALARSEESGRRVEPVAVDAGLVAEEALADLAPTAAEKRVRLVSELPDTPLPVLAEAQGLLEIFHNLGGNALRHSPEGGTVILSAQAGPEWVEFSVRDQGPGVPADYREKVFERFFRVDPNAVDKNGSAGLGLAICRQIARNFGGDVWLAETAPGAEGADFRFRLKTAPGDVEA
ncbi:MAG: ATP-binding protein [Desulfovibrio aminophilus]|jgi:two-component system phosphate regulon sensor histidine kinase PhoR|uniref:ATP-binding protein n=2 Tax=Desulfovibrio TaxID=872 RepID=UPI002A47DD69|nr:ATP-binding protein [Desulfovibrionaceae bacterium]